MYKSIVGYIRYMLYHMHISYLLVDIQDGKDLYETKFLKNCVWLNSASSAWLASNSDSDSARFGLGPARLGPARLGSARLGPV